MKWQPTKWKKAPETHIQQWTHIQNIYEELLQKNRQTNGKMSKRLEQACAITQDGQHTLKNAKKNLRKKSSVSLVIREILIKTIIKYYDILGRMTAM